LFEPEVCVARQGVNGVRNITVDEVLAVLLFGLGRVAFEDIELG
jgi:hypothetical protein